MQRFLDQDSQSTVLATCYSVEPSTSKVHGFHYCTTLGAGKYLGYSGIPEVPSGTKSSLLSPPHDILDSRAERTWPGNRPEYKGEATHNIPEECERLFCDKLSATFLGERNSVRQESLGMDVYQNIQSNQIRHQHDRIQRWIEVWDYSSDAIYRGFVAEHNKERTLFVFFEDRALEHGLKSGATITFTFIHLDIPSNLEKPLRMSKDRVKTLQFPKFLLPSVFSTKPSAGLSPTDHRPQNTKTEKYLDGHVSYLRCAGCASHLCWTSQIISKGFTGRHGRAYLVSAEPVATAVSVSASSSPTASLPNTILQRPVPRQLVTGAHTVSDVSCTFCDSVLGWKYVAAEEESQRYKVGKFILETKKIAASSCWESPPGVDRTMQADHPYEIESGPADTEFDSQDEDECEDLFAGIWSPGLAARRRNREIKRRPAMWGIS
ncbi:Yippee-like protein [Penicillium expansum]|uniref:Yippee-like protein n=1 Tax=Penicillium expansum TaxID=27334 RepID=A0A0A2J3D4_PENEN|nr:Yippee-like protein [Penicillium expansum]KGO43839.1 Yippee-like protein [Penicillium expansum]KGO49306.1 Yippee-like protein [Penicillium expansum]KGO52195.1 Yippee-like protein [Penicillium expansum]